MYQRFLIGSAFCLCSSLWNCEGKLTAKRNPHDDRKGKHTRGKFVVRVSQYFVFPKYICPFDTHGTKIGKLFKPPNLILREHRKEVLVLSLYLLKALLTEGYTHVCLFRPHHTICRYCFTQVEGTFKTVKVGGGYILLLLLHMQR